ncbi:YtxH domain-containing protein [Staphylococcus canis]|uniref:YtxH domain-containing protein n=1 Tax=Staphylococcus canis TaxID=2724942 RepID=A0ABS0T694_9STAP|nr:YtxH domain-containing protein [Staphylococcus canis]MBI5974276.1 YtxH domain-containing protein [Staphylococcus canis]
MAKSNQFLRAALGIGSAVVAVALSKQKNRDKVKQEYAKYKENPESYKQRVQEKATQLSQTASDEINRIKEDPKSYVNEVKEDPKAFLSNKKESLLNQSNQEQHVDRTSTFDDEGGGDPSSNLHPSTERKLQDKTSENNSPDNLR